MDRFQSNNELILTDFDAHFFQLRVVLHQLFVTVNGKYQKSKKIATDSNYLRCHALLTVLHFPLETTCSCKQDTKERYWGQQFWQMERDISGRPTEMTISVGPNRNGPFHLMNQPKFPEFGVEWKAPFILLQGEIQHCNINCNRVITKQHVHSCIQNWQCFTDGLLQCFTDGRGRGGGGEGRGVGECLILKQGCWKLE